MYRLSIVVPIFSLVLVGCHPPDKAIYEESKECAGVFDVAARQIPSNQLRKAGLYYDDVERAAVDTFEAALRFGENTGLDKKTILKEVFEAKVRARQTYGRPAAADTPSPKLLSALKQCMPKPDGPND